MRIKYNDSVYIYQTRREQAVVNSLTGDHQNALAVLKNTFQLARSIYKQRPAFYFDFLNSLAVELNEVGQIDAAQYFINIALASPFAPYYDGWLETSVDLKEKRGLGASGAVFVGKSVNKLNVVQGPFAATMPIINHGPKNSDVVELTTWKSEMPKINNNQEALREKPSHRETKSDKLQEIMGLIGDNDLNENQLDEVRDLLRRLTRKEAEHS